MFSLPGLAQDHDTTQWYSFWVGDWDLTWQDRNGNTFQGTNHIVRILDGAVIQENFEAKTGPLTGFKGTSLSVYNPRKREWRQAWADNQGGYFDFTGRKEGDRYYFETQPVETPQGTVQQRMVFYDITEDSLVWDWEASQDGGQTWNLNWRINYQRQAKM